MKKCEICLIGVEGLDFQGFDLIYSDDLTYNIEFFIPFLHCPNCGNKNKQKDKKVKI